MSLEKSNERDHDADHKGHEKDRVHNKNHERSRGNVNKTMAIQGRGAHTTSAASGHDHSMAVKHG